MFAKLRARRPGHATVVSYLALFIALGGTTAYAADTIGSSDVIDESLQSQDIKNSQVKHADLAGNSVTSTNIFNGSVLGPEIHSDAVDSSKVKDDTLTGNDIDEQSLNVPLADGLKAVPQGLDGPSTTRSSAKTQRVASGVLSVFSVPTFGTLTGRCNASSYNFSYENSSVFHFHAWMDVGGGDALRQDLEPTNAGSSDTIASAANTGTTGGEAITLHVGSTVSDHPIALTIWAFGSRSGSSCDFSFQALSTS